MLPTISKDRLKGHLIDITFMLPVLFMFISLVVVPFMWGLPLSFTDWNGLSEEMQYVGFKNYITLFSDIHVGNAFKNTFIFALMTVTISNVLGLAISLTLRRSNTFNNSCKTIIFMPYCLSMILQSFVWKYMYSDVFYKLLKIPNPLASPTFAIIGISFICIWADTGYCMLIYVAALQSISQEYFEVGQIDGANRWQQFRHIIFPLLWPAMVSNIVIYLGWGLRVYDYPMAATSGGPGRASETVAMVIYKNLFSYHKAGYGQAIAVIYTLMIFILIGIVAKILKKREVEI